MIDPISLIPAAKAISAPWGLFEGLRLALFLPHLIGVNILLGSAMILAADRGRGFLPAKVSGRLAHALPTVMALTVNLGVPPLLFLQVVYGHLFYTSSILMGWFWLAVVFVLIAAYYGLYWYDARMRSGLSSRAILVSLALLAVNAFLYVCNLSQTQNPGLWTGAVGNTAGTLLPFGDAALPPRLLHFLAGSAAVSGMALAVACRLGWVADGGGIATRFGLRLFLWATAVQALVGLWFLLSLPDRASSMLLGGGPLPTLWFALSLALAAAAVLLAVRETVLPAACALLGALIGMVLMRESVRLSLLGPYFHPQSLPVELETGPAVLFAVVLAAGALALAWLIRVFVRPGREA